MLYKFKIGVLTVQIEIKVLNKEFYDRRSKLERDNSTPLYDLPDYQTSGSAGLDLVCTNDILLYPGETTVVNTGLAIHIDCRRSLCNYMGVIAPRSGLGTRGLVLANTIGIIDEDYQGEIKVQIWNRLHSYNEASAHAKIIQLKAGDRFAQLILVPIEKAGFIVVDEFSSQTRRNEGGFGSTGV